MYYKIPEEELRGACKVSIENLEKWALYEEYKIFEDAYCEYESDWVRELQEKWEEQNDENEIIKPTEN